MRQAQVVIFAFEIHKGKEQGFLDRLPQDAGHLIPVHLDERGAHLNLVHFRDTTILYPIRPARRGTDPVYHF